MTFLNNFLGFYSVNLPRLHLFYADGLSSGMAASRSRSPHEHALVFVVEFVQQFMLVFLLGRSGMFDIPLLLDPNTDYN